MIDLSIYDHFIVFFSGGKDSFALLGLLLDHGVPKEKIELWHHEVDGKGNAGSLMDWEVTPDYCRKLAEAFEIPIYFSWREGGFEREMLRNKQKTAPCRFETPDSVKKAGGKRGKKTSRLKFPQTSPDLSVRWCSGALKIDVSRIAINNQDRFLNKKTLCLSGERGEESKARANYAKFEPHHCDNRDGVRVIRHVDTWRPIRDWTEQQVWDMMKKYKVNPHPAYRLGWGRVSCKTCIFASADQWASAKKVSPGQFNKISDYEKQFDHTIRHHESVEELAERGTPFEATNNKELVKLATSHEYTDPIFVEEWELPAGAFGDSAGPS